MAETRATDHATTDGDQETKDAVLMAFLDNVLFDGWRVRALDDAIAQVGAPELVFDRGIADLMAHFSDWADRQMLARVVEEGDAFHDRRIRDRVAFCVRARLEAIEAYKDVVRTFAGTAVTMRGPGPARLAWRTADTIWRACGDTATDFNHYSKRGLLVGVQTSTTLFWLADRSETNEATWRFLDRRIDEVLTVGRRLSGAQKLGQAAEMPFRAAKRIRDMLVTRAG